MTLWGLLMISVALALLFLRGLKGIFQAFVFTAPFFVTVITTIPLGDTILRTSYLFSAIFIVFYISRMSIRTRKSEERNLFLSKDLLPLYIFLFIIISTLFMPFFFANKISVISFDSTVGLTQEIEFKKLRFQQSNLTQLIYPLFQIILLTLITSYITRKDYIQETYNLLLCGCVVVLITGILHIVLVHIGSVEILEILSLVMRGSDNFSVAIDDGFAGLTRMYSWAGEPGYTSFLFLAIIGPVLGALLTGNYLIFKTRKWTMFIFSIFMAGIILSAGTTGYVGVIILFGFTFIASFAFSNKEVNIKKRYLVIPIFGLILLFIVLEFATGFSFVGYFQEEHLSKLTQLDSSGFVRFYVVSNNFQHFLESPIMGLGYGSERSLALSAFLLSNTGLAGFLSFIFFGLFLMKKMWDVMKSRHSTGNQKTWALGFFISFGTMFSLMQFAKSESSLLFHYFWIITACMLALNRIFKSQREILNRASDN